METLTLTSLLQRILQKISDVQGKAQKGCRAPICSPGTPTLKEPPHIQLSESLWTLSFEFLRSFHCTGLTEAWTTMSKRDWTKRVWINGNGLRGARPSKACLFLLASVQHSFLLSIGKDSFWNGVLRYTLRQVRQWIFFLWPAPRQRKDKNFYDLPWGRENLISGPSLGRELWSRNSTWNPLLMLQSLITSSSSF
jgi:hypothetical protein